MAKVYKRPETSHWWAEFQNPHGQRTRRSTGITNQDALKNKAQLVANQMELACWDQWVPGQAPIVEHTFEALAVTHFKGNEPSSIDKQNLKILKLYFQGFIFNDLNKKDVSGYIEWRRNSNLRFPGQPIGNSTIRRELGLLSSMINAVNEAWEWGLPNPIIGRRPKAPKARVRWATPDEANKLINAARQATLTPWLVDFIELGLNTGMRKTEMLACEWQRIDLSNHCIHLFPQHQKNGRYGTVALNKTAQKVILRRRSWSADNGIDSPWVFPSRSNRSQPMTTVHKPFAEVCSKIGLQNFRPHDLRHTFASWLVQAGVSLSELREAMRHADVKQTEQYAHLAEGVSQRVVSVLDQPSQPMVENRFKDDLTQYMPQAENG